MYEDIKEVYVGVVLGKDKKGEITPTSIYLRGRPVPKGIYTPDNPPPGWAWSKFVAKALQRDGRGIFVIREGAEQPALRKAMDDFQRQQDKDAEKQAKVLADREAAAKRPEPSKEPKAEVKD